MENIRVYGAEPYNVAVIHGGPGAPGSVASLAKELSLNSGVMEPLQTKDSIKGQIDELAAVLDEYGNKPVVLIGHSWGAWLSYMFAVKYPEYVKKILLIGCGAFDVKYLSSMNETRLKRLNEEENMKVKELIESLNNTKGIKREITFKEFGKLMSKADSYKPIVCESDDIIGFQPEIFEEIMDEIRILRSSGELLSMGSEIQCPVVAIHGDYDPHPYIGVKEPLEKVVNDFRFILLEKCGHTPWNEYYAKEQFYKVLMKEIID